MGPARRGRDAGERDRRAAGLGLAGLEVDHQDHPPADREQLRAIARHLDLVVTGSSDHHGTGKDDHELGCNTTAPEEYERLLDLAAAAAARSARRHTGGHVMTRYAIDAPTLLHIVTEELVINPEHQPSRPTRSARRHSRSCSGRCGGGELSEKDAGELRTRLTELKIRVLGDRVSRATSFKIANEQGWETTFDAEYLAVARLQADAFVTVDEEMAKKAEGLVPLAPLSALSD